jgi:hypothetical protein
MSAAERVAAGAAFLDEHRPGWRGRVEAHALDMGDAEHCVLGQLFGDFGAGLDALEIAQGRAMELGFVCDYWNEDECTCDSLAPCWLAELERVPA